MENKRRLNMNNVVFTNKSIVDYEIPDSVNYIYYFNSIDKDYNEDFKLICNKINESYQ